MDEKVSELQPLAVKPSTAGRLLEIGVTKTYDLIRQGVLETVMIGADRRVTMESIKRVAKVAP